MQKHGVQTMILSTFRQQSKGFDMLEILGYLASIGLFYLKLVIIFKLKPIF